MNNKKERLIFLLKKNHGNQIMSKYLETLSNLILKKNYKLLSLEDSTNIFHARQKLSNKHIVKIKNNDFSDKRVLKEVISKIEKICSVPLYMMIDYSEYCGIALIENLACFNVDFLYNQYPNGNIIFFDTNLKNYLLIDTDYLEEDSFYYYDLTIKGKQWTEIINYKM